MFGGEKYDGQKVQVFGDLHRWNVEKNEWRQIVSPVMPKARCSHQAVVYKYDDEDARRSRRHRVFCFLLPLSVSSSVLWRLFFSNKEELEIPHGEPDSHSLVF